MKDSVLKAPPLSDRLPLNFESKTKILKNEN